MDYIHKVKKHSKCGIERLNDLEYCVRDLIAEGIPGAFVETGVWAGGCCMLMAYILKEKKTLKNIWMYDTFGGMTKPSKIDKKFKEDTLAIEKWEKTQNKTWNDWCHCSLRKVKQNMAMTGYNPKAIITVKGDVCETIPKYMPKAHISLLRLDTDFYESTKQALIHLFPKLSVGGYLIIDDYNCWEGAKKAVDEYFDENGLDKKALYEVDRSCVVYKNEKKEH